MGGLLDAQVHIATESAYNVLTTPTRSIEAKADVAKAKFSRLQAIGMRAGLEAPRFDRSRTIAQGAEGEIQVDMLNKGMGLLLKAALGTSSIAQVGGTTAWLQTHSTAPAASADSLTVQIGRPVVDPATAPLPFTYTGGKCTEWTLSQKIGDQAEGLLQFNMSMDYAVEDITEPLLAVPVYPAADYVFGWDNCKVTLNSVEQSGVQELELTSNLGLAVDRYRLRRSTAKMAPARGEFPEHSGSMLADFDNMTIYNLIRAGTPVPLVFEWEGPTIVDTNKYFFRVTMAQVLLVGETPEVSLEDFPKQPIQFVVVKDNTNPAIKIEYQSTDIAF